MKDVDEPIHAFAYINNALLHLNETEHAAFRSAVFSRIPALVDLSRYMLLPTMHFQALLSQTLFYLIACYLNTEKERSCWLLITSVQKVHGFSLN